MRVTLSSYGLHHYPRKGKERADKVGVVLDTLPSGFHFIEWPWGLAFNAPGEVQRAP